MNYLKHFVLPVQSFILFSLSILSIIYGAPFYLAIPLIALVSVISTIFTSTKLNLKSLKKEYLISFIIEAALYLITLLVLYFRIGSLVLGIIYTIVTILYLISLATYAIVLVISYLILKSS